MILSVNLGFCFVLYFGSEYNMNEFCIFVKCNRNTVYLINDITTLACALPQGHVSSPKVMLFLCCFPVIKIYCTENMGESRGDLIVDTCTSG